MEGIVKAGLNQSYFFNPKKPLMADLNVFNVINIPKSRGVSFINLKSALFTTHLSLCSTPRNLVLNVNI